MDLWRLLIPFIAFFVNITIQICFCRFITGMGLLKSIYWGFLAGVLVGLLSEIILGLYFVAFNIDVIIYGLTNGIIYIALSYGYFHFLNLGETARRVRILREMNSVSTGLKLNELLSRYNAESIVHIRMKRLLNTGQVVLEGNRYKIGKPFVLFMANIIVFMKMMILQKKSEFE
ncbi:MAG: hypothetical protein HQK77_16320 [Desulfobacterales bacterium]|nr:hypothetical protein [Desulfobacterales bacterium]